MNVSVLGRPPKKEIRPWRAAIEMACSWVTLAEVAVMMTSAPRPPVSSITSATTSTSEALMTWSGWTASADILRRSSLMSTRTRDDAITEAGRLLVTAGAVDESSIDSMREREASVSTMMGNGLAIPHGTNAAKGSIRHSALSFVRYDEDIDWNGKPAEFVVGIAGAGDDDLSLLRSLATVFADESQVARLRAATSADEVLAMLDGVSV